MPSIPHMTDDPKPPGVVLPYPVRRGEPPYWESQAHETRIANRLAEEIADAHLGDYLNGRFDGLDTLDRFEASWFKAAGAYALRYCRRAWRLYAHDHAVDAAVRAATDYMSQYFMEPSQEDPSVRVSIKPAHLRALMAILTKEILSAHRAVLDGSTPVPPGEYVRLERGEDLREGRHQP